MKKSSLVLIVVLIVLVAVGWISQLGHIASKNVEYKTCLNQASMYYDEGLYQKAIACYDQAFLLKDKEDVRKRWLDAHKKAYEDRAITASAYSKALLVMCDLYPKEAGYWETLLELHVGANDLKTAYECYTLCGKAGTISKKIEEYGNIIMYSFRVTNRPYTQFVRNATGYYTVYDGENWGIIRPNGETVYDCIYEYISPYNAEYMALFVSEKGQRVADAQAVIQAKIDIEFEKTGAYSSGLLPVQTVDGVWKYLDCKTNKYVLDSYEYATSFSDGVAAVCKNGKWTLIDTSGKQVCKTAFSDIKIHSNGSYLFEGIMIAAVNGEYAIYDASGNACNKFKAKDMDVYMGGNIAYSDGSGKWGFVTVDGTVVQKPIYTKAKSYCNNLAAVNNGEAWGFINADGSVVIDYQFLEADYFTADGVCIISNAEGRYCLLKLRFTEK